MTAVAILTDTVPPTDAAVHDTPYGRSAPITQAALAAGTTILLAAPGFADPRATVRALKDRGASHLWLCESVGALSPLLEPGDWLVPDDFIDGTRGQHYTTFSEKAGGYIQQVPPFDPASRDSLLLALRTLAPQSGEPSARVFRRGVYVCVSNTRLETPAEATFWSRGGAHIVGRYLSPFLPLAREMEMQVAVLALVTREGGRPGGPAPFDRYAPVLARALAPG